VSPTPPMPSDVELELCVLGAVLVGSDALAEAQSAGAQPDMFHSHLHRAAWEAVVSIATRGEPVDVPAVVAEMRRSGSLAKGPSQREVEAKLVEAVAKAPTIRGIARHVAELRLLADRRRAIGLADGLRRWAHDEAASPEHLRALAAEAVRLGEGLAPGASRAMGRYVGAVDRKDVAWLWPGRLPRGKTVLLDGDPGLGKSTLALDLAARVTTGSPMPTGERPGEPGGVVLLSAEDDLPDTIRPRFDAAGGDPDRLYVFEAVLDADGRERLPHLVADLDTLGEVIRDVRAALVVVDVLAAYLGGVDTHRDSDVRAALMPLRRLAEETGACVLALRHLNKSGGTNPLYRGGGSIGFTGTARVVLLAARDPDDEERRVLAVVKNNLCRGPVASLAFRVVDGGGASRIAWEGPVERSAADLLVSRDPEERAAMDEAVEFLRGLLAGGQVAAKDVFTAARDAGIAEKTLKRAKATLGVRSRREGFGPGSTVWWRLPSATERGDTIEGQALDPALDPPCVGPLWGVERNRRSGGVTGADGPPAAAIEGHGGSMPPFWPSMAPHEDRTPSAAQPSATERGEGFAGTEAAGEPVGDAGPSLDPELRAFVEGVLDEGGGG
jgi:hypothetical protein